MWIGDSFGHDILFRKERPAGSQVYCVRQENGFRNSLLTSNTRCIIYQLLSSRRFLHSKIDMSLATLWVWKMAPVSWCKAFLSLKSPSDSLSASLSMMKVSMAWKMLMIWENEVLFFYLKFTFIFEVLSGLPELRTASCALFIKHPMLKEPACLHTSWGTTWLHVLKTMHTSFTHV